MFSKLLTRSLSLTTHKQPTTPLPPWTPQDNADYEYIRQQLLTNPILLTPAPWVLHDQTDYDYIKSHCDK